MAAPHAPGALIVSRNTQTAEGLRSYFERCGVNARTTDRFDAAADRNRFSAIVVFPDEFAAESAGADIIELASRFPRSWIIVVTRQTAHFDELRAKVETQTQGRLLVLPRPAWGWALLDRVLAPPSLGATSAFTPRDP